jgi:hypothetical protein
VARRGSASSRSPFEHEVSVLPSREVVIDERGQLAQLLAQLAVLLAQQLRLTCGGA